MAKVFFKAIGDHSGTGEISAAGRALLERVLEEEDMKLEGRVPLKVHFGEAGNVTYIGPENFDGIVDLLEELGVEGFFTDTNTLYNGERMVRKDHEELARAHGFTRLPVVIADGDHGDDFTEVMVNKKHFTTCKIGKEITKYSQLLIVSHFKGHMLAGFGGAVKQLGMGCAARGGKLAMHMSSKPRISRWKCEKCGTCVAHCPADAIVEKRRRYKIVKDDCIGCASCFAVCPRGAVKFNWISASLFNTFYEKLAEYALAAQTGGARENIYIQFALNLTRGCDCMGKRMKPFLPDLGVLASVDPVAVDQATLDLIRSRDGKRFRGRHALRYGEKIGLGSRDYELVRM